MAEADERFPDNVCTSCKKPKDCHCFQDWPVIYCPGLDGIACIDQGPYHLRK